MMYKISSEKSFEPNEIDKLFENSPALSFDGYSFKDNKVEIDYKEFKRDDAKATVIIAHGYSESYYFYKEVIYDFFNNGYSVIAFNFRGHGRSRLVEDERHPVYLDSADALVSDFTKIVELARKLSSDKKVLLYGHSFGASVASNYMLEGGDDIDAAVFTTPMLGMKLPVPPSVITPVLKFLVARGLGSKLIPGENVLGDKKPHEDSVDKSIVRAEFERTTMSGDEMWTYRNLGPTFGFVSVCLELTNNITTGDISKISCPIMLFQAEDDQWVDNSAQDKFVSSCKTCTMIKVAGTKHEIYKEADPIRTPYMSKILSFYDDNSYYPT